MDKTFNISVKSKQAKNLSKIPYVCGNTDYRVAFDFDDDWNQYPIKTARFVAADGKVYEQTVTDDSCAFPQIMDTFRIEVGVYAGDLATTTPAVVECLRSILSGTGATPEVPEPDRYNQMMEAINADALRAEEAAQDAETSASEAKEAAEKAKGLGMFVVKLTAQEGTMVSVSSHNYDEITQAVEAGKAVVLVDYYGYVYTYSYHGRSTNNSKYWSHKFVRQEITNNTSTTYKGIWEWWYEIASDGHVGGWTATPAKTPNPYKLKLTGAVEAEYDGSEAMTVEIPQGGGIDEEQLNQAVQEALQEAKESGEFDGEDGYTPVKGKDYFDGEPGADGFSPTVDVTAITGGHRVEIIYKDGKKSFDVLDGKDGKDASGGGNSDLASYFGAIFLAEDGDGGLIPIELDGGELETVDYMALSQKIVAGAYAPVIVVSDSKTGTSPIYSVAWIDDETGDIVFAEEGGNRRIIISPEGVPSYGEEQKSGGSVKQITGQISGITVTFDMSVADMIALGEGLRDYRIVMYTSATWGSDSYVVSKVNYIPDASKPRAYLYATGNDEYVQAILETGKDTASFKTMSRPYTQLPSPSGNTNKYLGTDNSGNYVLVDNPMSAFPTLQALEMDGAITFLSPETTEPIILTLETLFGLYGDAGVLNLRVVVINMETEQASMYSFGHLNMSEDPENPPYILFTGDNGKVIRMDADGTLSYVEEMQLATQQYVQDEVAKATDEGVYELIETITLTEDTNVIERTQEPDGTPYDFTAMYLDFFVKPSNTSNSHVRTNYKFGNDASYHYMNLIDAGVNKEKEIRWYERIYNAFGYWFVDGYFPYAAYSTAYMQYSLCPLLANVVPATKNIKAIKVETNTTEIPFSAGSVIKIWGVRANA